jgi:carbon monoxide dehydrogenase subunit G
MRRLAVEIAEEAGDMRVEGGQTVAGDAERVCAALLDADALARAIPGCERLIQLGPPGAGGAVAFEARVRAAGAVATVSIRVTAARPPAYLRIELRGAGPGNAFSGRGAVDLVPRDGHTAVAFAFDVEATGAASVSAEACRQTAQAICARLVAGAHVAHVGKPTNGTVEPLAELEAVQITTRRGRIVALPPLPPRGAALTAPLWARRALWMGTGALLGISAITVMSAVMRRLVNEDE